MSLGFTRYSVQTELANANPRREVAVTVLDTRRTLTVSVKDIVGLMFFVFYIMAGITHFRVCFIIFCMTHRPCNGPCRARNYSRTFCGTQWWNVSHLNAEAAPQS